jgi:crossover junction endodeoxyribonuclease RuvC
MAKRKKVVMGLDLSLTHTGVSVIKGDEFVFSGVIRSTPIGDRPIDELYRILQIVYRIDDLVDKYQPEMVCIENLAFMAKNTTSLVQLSALNFFVRNLLKDRNIVFSLVAPTSVKKFISGKGNVDKNIIMMEVFKQYGFSPRDDNEADAAALSIIAMALLNKPLHKLTKAQKETLQLLEKQF